MPIKVRYSDLEKARSESVAYLCEDEWDLAMQLGALEEWLGRSREGLPDDDLVADVGFTVRKDPKGGGSAMSCAFLRSLADARIELWLSEYPPGDIMTFGESDEE